MGLMTFLASPEPIALPPGGGRLVRADVDWDASWLPHLSLVAISGGRIVGHVVCTRAHVDDAPALGLGPLSVHPDLQGRGVGPALVREVLTRAEETDETLVALLGDPAYYRRFGFAPAGDLGVLSPDDSYGDYFQARALGSGGHPRGRFRYAAPFDLL